FFLPAGTFSYFHRRFSGQCARLSMPSVQSSVLTILEFLPSSPRPRCNIQDAYSVREFSMKVWGAKPIERAIRAARDRYIVGPLARSRLIQRHAHFGYDYSVKKLDDHLIAYDPRDRGMGSHLMRRGEWFRDDFRAVLSTLVKSGVTTKDKVFVDV